MQQLIVEFTDLQFPRVLKACGVTVGLPRDAVPAEVVAFLYNRLKEITLAVEKNTAVAAAAGPAWDDPPP
jgi:hypothetical protein